MATLTDLLNDLGKNAELAASWEKDPEAVMEDYKLTDNEKQAMLAGDVEALRKASGMTSLNMTNGTVKSHSVE